MSDEPQSKILVERDGPVAHVWFNRPDKHNAFDGETVALFQATLTELQADESARVIVLGGKGKSFSAGADLRWMASQGRSGDNASGVKLIAGLFDAINDSPKPIIARVHGNVRGGGNGIVACCDIAVGTTNATFALTEVRLGLAPAVISPYVIGRIGVPAARELFITGDVFDAERAASIGMLNRVAPDVAALDATIAAFCTSIAKGGPNAVAACKQLALNVMETAKGERLQMTADLLATLRSSPEGQEGMTAFVQRRAPSWVTTK